MAVDFVSYRYEDGVVWNDVRHAPTRGGFGVRHIEALYLFTTLCTLHMTQASTQITTLAIIQQNNAQHSWNYRAQAAIFTSFYVGYCVVSVPAQMYHKMLNPKYVIFVVLLLNGLLSFATPLVIEKGGWFAMSNVRLLLGMCHAWTPSAVRRLLQHWIPPQERSTLAAFVHSGIQVGTVISFPLACHMSQSVIGWRMICYMWGVVSLCAATVWCTLTSTTPEEHRAIGDGEKEYIQQSINNHTMPESDPMRWRRLLGVRAFWAMTASHMAARAVHMQFLFLVPIFLSQRLQMPASQLGWGVGVPFLAMALLSLSLLPMSGDLYKNTILGCLVDITTYRKLLNSAGSLGTALGLSLLSALSAEHRLLIAFVLVITYAFIGLKLCGFMENATDAMPEYSGGVLQLSTIIAEVGSCLVPALDSFALDMRVSEECRWHVVFVCSVCLCVACDVMYIVLSSSEPDAWRSHRFKSLESDEKGYDMEELARVDDHSGC